MVEDNWLVHTDTAAATQRPQGVHPAPWRAPSSVTATQITGRAAATTSDPLESGSCLVAIGDNQLVGDN